MLLLLWIVFLAGVIPTLAQFNGAIGGSAYIYAKNTEITPQHQISWKLDSTTTVIANVLPGTNATYSGRCTNGRCELFTNGTLRMDLLTSSDNRTYTVTSKLGTVDVNEVVTLNVYSVLTKPSLTASSSVRPVNGSTLRLTCNAGSQTVHNVYFYRDEEVVDCNMAHLSCNDSSYILDFNPILDIDTGNYSCAIRNPVSQNISSSLLLNVAVRVSAVTLHNNVTRPLVVEKDSVSLTCSSYGTDLSYDWTFIGTPLIQNPRYHLTNDRSTLVISPVTRADQGSFMCRIYNYLNSGISNPLNLTWLPDGHLTCDAQRSDHNIRLYCSWPGGYPPAEVHMLYPSVNSTQYNQVITEIPFSQFPLGTPLSCTGKHEGSSESCSLIIDTPQYPGFINETSRAGKKGSSVFLPVTLSSERAAQTFPSKFSWFRQKTNLTELFNGEDISIVSNDYSSFLILHSVTNNMVGQYICKAENVIGANFFAFTVELEKDSLSAGAVAGIVIACVGVLAVIALTVVLVIRYRKTKGKDYSDAALVDQLHMNFVLQQPVNSPQNQNEPGVDNGSGEHEYANQKELELSMDLESKNYATKIAI